MRRLILGIDIGGTNIKMGLINHAGRVIYRTNLATRSFVQDKTLLIEALVVHSQDILLRNRLHRKDLLGIGIGLPGLIDFKHGLVNCLVNIHGWKNVPLKKIIERKLKISTFIDNDVNLMTLAEWRYGAGRGIKNVVCLTLGTGVGGGLIIENKLYRGEGFTAGELGHIPLNEEGPQCNCGGYGCLERYVGNHPLLEKAKKIFKRHISLEEINQLANKNNSRALEFWREVAVHLGNGLSGIVNLLNPQCIIIGGGIANAHRHLFREISTTIQRRSLKIPAKMVKILKAKLGDDAGMIGAQVLVHEATLS
jgi:glucokinase